MLCRLLLAAALLAMLLGAWIIWRMPIAPWLRAAGATIWCLLAARDIIAIARSYKRFRKLRIDADGSAALQDGDGRWQAACLRRGCVVLDRLAWLRLRLEDGRHYRVLVRGDARESQQWRRLQVIWRQLGSDARSC